MRCRIILGLFAFFVVAQAPAQKYVHLFGGTTAAPDDAGSLIVVGGGAESGRIYLSGEGYSLRPGGGASSAFKSIANELLGVNLSIKASGFGFAGGGAIKKSDRLSIIPIGIVGFTSGEICVDASCDDILKEINYGGGVVARIMASPKIGFHAGIRYTLHYGTAFTAGVVFKLGRR